MKKLFYFDSIEHLEVGRSDRQFCGGTGLHLHGKNAHRDNGINKFIDVKDA